MGRDVAAFLELGHQLEAAGRFADAVAAYDNGITRLRSLDVTGDPGVRHALAIAWMNRGNALQREGTAPHLLDAVRAYDEAIEYFRSLPTDSVPALRNSLGAAWLNRGHALMLTDAASAISSFESAAAILALLPLEADPSFRLNLAGAYTNLAQAHLGIWPSEAVEAARRSLAVLTGVEHTHEAFAALSLHARVAFVKAMGALLIEAQSTGASTTELAVEATDAVETGLALTRELETCGRAKLRSLALVLFRLGGQLYRTHQPHFLAEFVIENLAHPAFAADSDFRAAADESLAAALTDLQRTQFIVAGTAETTRLLQIAHSLREARQILSALPAHPIPVVGVIPKP